MKVREIVKATGGRLLSGDANKEIDPSKISTDSRGITKGEFFIALKGDNFDGNGFVKDAFKKGAIGVIGSGEGLRPAGENKIVIRVKETTKALQDIAAHHRGKFRILNLGL